MNTRAPILIVTCALALMAACGPEPGEEPDPDVAFADPLAFSAVDMNADSVIEQDELLPWLEAQLSDAAGSDAGDRDPGLSDQLDLTLTEAEWRDSGRYLFTRSSEPAEFEQWDTDGDGLLDPAEALAGLDAEGEDDPVEMGPIADPGRMATVLFRLWDLDGNGALELDEYRGGILVWWP